jgi:predicted DNA-binding WGR domain protein
MNSNKFYKLQLLEKNGKYHVATNWGRLGEPGKHQLKGPFDEQKGITEFSKVFRSKTKNNWGAHPFIRHGDKYQLIETTIDDAEGETAGDQALGRLTEAQIQKGQAVLQNIRSVLQQREDNKRARVNRDELGNLSNDFYSLIPTQSGRQKPPLLDNIDIITEKEGLLEFWLRMGFEELSPQNVDGSPIQGVLDLPVPKTLTVAASGIADRGSITSSQSRGKELSKNAVGNPRKEMGPELYAAILLYTGNAIYRELNRCLRVEWKSAVKYWNYLRLYFEATDCLPKRNVTLWRGIAADLYNEYEPGKVITWWTVSSCTASKDVAQNFMNQLGGSAATLLTLHTKQACDISALSFYPHEQESLLSPGTKLKVLKRTRNGKVAEIEVEEVVEEELDKDQAEKEISATGADNEDDMKPAAME